MEKYNVKISTAAQKDFLELTESLDTLPPDEAVKYYDSILESTKVLATNPESCPFARDSQLRVRRYRLLTVDKYIYFFVVTGKTVGIRRILFARRQYEKIL